MILLWKEQNIVNTLTYQRLQAIKHSDQNDLHNWGKILSKILAES